jgi:REP element-mobilizing transposase RayT
MSPIPDASKEPLAYFITFRCYGTWLPGDERGTVNKYHNQYTTAYMPADAKLHANRAKSLCERPYYLDEERREIVKNAIQEVCRYKDWTLYTMHVRTNHVHCLVGAHFPPEIMMAKFKAYASRALNIYEKDDVRKLKQNKRWVRHGSTRYLWTSLELHCVLQYIVEEQGDPMAIYEPEWWKADE